MIRFIRSRCFSSLKIRAIACLLCGIAPSFAQREDRVLESDWKFIRKDAGLAAKTETWEAVSIPHTWNVVDGANGIAADPDQPEGYYRGPAWYARPLDVSPAWKNKRVFIRFEAASLVSDVFINGIHVGHHRGAFGAFCYEIGSYLKFDGKDSLKVRVDNAKAYDVAPLSGDFTIFGGIYRPVHLIATDSICISPIDHASPGIYFNFEGVRENKGTVNARVAFSNGEAHDSKVELRMEVMNVENRVVTTATEEVSVKPGQSVVSHRFEIANARLWKGKADPYLYSVKVSLVKDGKVIDEVLQPLGLRTVSLAPDGRFLLNGEPYLLRGVNSHQERKGKGWAISDEDRREDNAAIVEMGANAVRLAHYQQADFVHTLNDRAGLVAWQETPLIDCVSGSPEFLANARQQLTEMILQGWNHPSLCFWSLFNELDAVWAAVKTAPSPPVIADLNRFAHELDSSRVIAGAALQHDPRDVHRITDAMGWNIYPGWYSGKVEDATKMVDGFADKLGKTIALSEYGAGANPFHHSGKALEKPTANGFYHPQEWQNHYHESYWAQIRNHPKLWGAFIWVMFDFASDKRNEGGVPGQNDKGLVTADRKIRKDTFYFYKANWSDEPVVRLTSKYAVERQENVTTVKAYSNCEEVELKVNGKSLGKKSPDDLKIVHWPDVSLQPGPNRIELAAIKAGKTLTDSAEWVVKP
ncbi:MAG TPA: glycoside hydrolase family 2 TIM barrel-domain containing protein [Luteolibacter sp.]